MPKQLFKPSEIQQTFEQLNMRISNAELFQAIATEPTRTPIELSSIQLTPGYQLVRLNNRLPYIKQDHFELVVVNHLLNEVVYYNRVIFQPDAFLNHLPVTQILVWRTPNPLHNAALQGLAGKVFTQYLLKNYNVVITDRHQTQQGQNFWLTRLYEALNAEKFVYGYDMITCELRQIETPDQIGVVTSWLWGDDDNYQNRLAIISTMALPGEPQ